MIERQKGVVLLIICVPSKPERHEEHSERADVPKIRTWCACIVTTSILNKTILSYSIV